MIIETKRLSIQFAEVSDEEIEFILSLWTHPDVMKFVGFPHGLKTDKAKIKKQLMLESNSEIERVLLVRTKIDNELIGNCKLGNTDASGIAHTDVKVHPQFWGNKYGVEIKRALVDYLFMHTDCKGVRGDPNKLNIASIKMQEAVGGKRIREFSYKFPEEMKSYTTDLELYEYIVSRADWEKNN